MKKNILFPLLLLIFVLTTLFIVNGDSFAYEFGDWSDEDAITISNKDVDENMTYGKVYMEAQSLDGDILQLSIKSEDMITPVLGIAFHLLYDKETLYFLKYEPGNFLERGGDPFYLVKNNQDKIIYGETLRRDDSFPVGEGVIAKFYFQILEDGVYKFLFENGVVSTLDTTRQDIDRIAWENLEYQNGESGFLINSGEIGSVIPKLKNSVYSNEGGFVFAIMGILFISLLSAVLIILFLRKKWINQV